MTSGKNILLIISGSVAAVKTTEYKNAPGIVEELKARGFNIRVIASKAALEYGFVNSDKVAEITGNKPFSAANAKELAEWADIVLSAPATANFIAELAHDSGELAKAINAAGKKKFITPAMNLWMWAHPATQGNITKLIGDGWQLIGPTQGNLACGENGYGRMVEPAEIAAAVGGENRSYKNTLIKNAKLPQPDIKPQKVLFVLAGVAAEDAKENIQALAAQGLDVTCVSDRKEDTAKLAEYKVYTHHFQFEDDGMEHINLSRRNDIVVIQADAKHMELRAKGESKSLTGDVYLATNKPVYLISKYNIPQVLIDHGVIAIKSAVEALSY